MRYIIEGADREYGGVIRVELDLSEVQTVRDARAWAQAHGIVVRSAIPLTRRQQARIQSKQRRSDRHWILPGPRSARLWFAIAGLAFLLVFPPIRSNSAFLAGSGFGFSFPWQIWTGGEFIFPISQHATYIDARSASFMPLTMTVYAVMWVAAVFAIGTLLKLCMNSLMYTAASAKNDFPSSS